MADLNLKKILTIVATFFSWSNSSAMEQAGELSAESKETLTTGAYFLQKEVCNSYFQLLEQSDANDTSQNQKQLIESIIEKITDDPISYCEDVTMFQGGTAVIIEE